jgi:hypothetical protein
MDVTHTFRPMFEGLDGTKPCMFGLMFCHLVIWWEAPGPVLTNGGLLAHSVGCRSTFHGKVLLPRVHKHSLGEMLRLTVPNDHVAYLLAASCWNQQSLEFRWFFSEAENLPRPDRTQKAPESGCNLTVVVDGLFPSVSTLPAPNWEPKIWL